MLPGYELRVPGCVAGCITTQLVEAVMENGVGKTRTSRHLSRGVVIPMFLGPGKRSVLQHVVEFQAYATFVLQLVLPNAANGVVCELRSSKG